MPRGNWPGINLPAVVTTAPPRRAELSLGIWEKERTFPLPPPLRYKIVHNRPWPDRSKRGTGFAIVCNFTGRGRQGESCALALDGRERCRNPPPPREVPIEFSHACRKRNSACWGRTWKP